MPELPQTRQSLLLELGKCSPDAWHEFLVVYEQAIVRYCTSKGLQEADARDVTQDVLAAVHRKIATWDADSSRGSFRAWLFRVARNISIDTIADRAKRFAASGDTQVAQMLQQVAVAGGDSAAEFDVQYHRSVLDWASKQVKSEVREITWTAFQRTAIQGQNAEDVAQDLEIPIGSVYTAKCRVMARIRDKVAELDGDLPPPAEW